MDIDDGSLPTLKHSGLTDPESAFELVAKMVNADRERDWLRSKVNGLIDGNAPFDPDTLIEAGRADACNVNWRMPEAYVNQAQTVFDDITREVPTFAEVEGEDPANPSQAIEWSNFITTKFDDLQRTDSTWDHSMQVSQANMVRHGTGPLLFDTVLDWRCCAIPSGRMLVPDRAPSDVNQWELAVLLVDYLPHRLFSFINNDRASEAGWNIKMVRTAIMQAHPRYGESNLYSTWEWHQEQLKNKALFYSYLSRDIHCARIYVREFPKKGQAEGRVTEGIISLETSPEGQARDFLYRRVGVYKNWHECVHPMYYDRGGSSGLHHHVTGMGVKMYSSMDTQNRLLCNAVDKTNAAKVLFRPSTNAEQEKFMIAQMGDYAVMPAGFEVQQTMVQGMIDDSLAMNRELTMMLSSNLSQYRQNLQKEDGNPITAREVSWRASELGRINASQIGKYFEQLDWLYAEKYRRAINPALTADVPGGKEAKEFQDACRKFGIPRKFLENCRVKATRTVGAGNVFMRQQALQFLLGISPSLPEAGRTQLYKDVIGAYAGQPMVERYWPAPTMPTFVEDELAWATLENAALVQGAPVVIASTQNHAVHLTAHLSALNNAVKSLGQGANPADVLTFLDNGVAHAAQHLQALAQDQSREDIVKPAEDALKTISKVADQIRQQLTQQAQQQAQQMAEAQQNGNGQMDVKDMLAVQKAQLNTEIKTNKAQLDAALKTQRFAQDSQIKSVQTAQDMAIKDAQSAATIRRARMADTGNES